MNTQDLIIELRDVLDENLNDPIEERALDGKNWIYEDFPRLDSTLPRIGIGVVDVEYTSLALGTPKRVKNATLQVAILVDSRRNKFDVDGDGETEVEEQVLNYIAQRVEEEIVNNQPYFRNDVGVRYMLPINSFTTRNEDENVIQRNIDIEVEFQ